MSAAKKEKLPWDIKQQCLWIVRGYDRQRREYMKARREILDAGSARFTTYTVNGEERRAFLPGGHTASRTTEDRQMQLEALENTAAFRQMRAVEHARAGIGGGLPRDMADQLRDAIMLNCMDGRKYPFEKLCIIGLERTTFYRARNGFLLQIAVELGLFRGETTK